MIRQTEAEVCIDRQADFIKMTISWEVKVKMRQVYESPKMFVQEFVPNEYVAACGDSGVVYKFKCDAGGGVSGSVYVESNGVEGLQTRSSGSWWGGDYVAADRSLGGYHACGTTHEADSDDEFLDGYYVPYWSDDVTKVIIWRGPYNNNVHCTTNLNKNEWETAKS